MSFPTFEPSVAPSPRTTYAPEIKLRSSGTGVEGVRGEGNSRKVVNLKWKVLTAAQMQDLAEFFTIQQGDKPFFYRPFGFDTSVLWTCKEWSASYGMPHGFSATLRQSFTLDA